VIEKFWKHLNSASKNTSETDIFPHGTKCLLLLDITTVLHGLNIHMPFTKFLDTFLIRNFIFSCGPTFFLIYVVKAWACFVHACLHTMFVWAHYRALQGGRELTIPLPNIPRRSVHACRALCTVYHGKWHAYTDANSVATHIIVYMVWVQIHMVSKQGYS
jgi:hypothetical protein